MFLLRQLPGLVGVKIWRLADPHTQANLGGIETAASVSAYLGEIQPDNATRRQKVGCGMNVPELDNLIGRRIKTHYNTGGVVTSYSGPHGTGYNGEPGYSVTYRDAHGDRCWLNSITVVGGVVICESQPLQIFEQVDAIQTDLFS